jgi:hypothetical protein
MLQPSNYHAFRLPSAVQAFLDRKRLRLAGSRVPEGTMPAAPGSTRRPYFASGAAA